jgi:hypothetical protein
MSPGATRAELTPRGVGTPLRIKPPGLQTVAKGRTSASKRPAVIIRIIADHGWSRIDGGR